MGRGRSRFEREQRRARKRLRAGGAIIRQDLEPVLTELFVREFPTWKHLTEDGYSDSSDFASRWGGAKGASLVWDSTSRGWKKE